MVTDFFSVITLAYRERRHPDFLFYFASRVVLALHEAPVRKQPAALAGYTGRQPLIGWAGVRRLR